MVSEEPQDRPTIKVVFDELQSQRGVIRPGIEKEVADFDLD